MIKNFIKITHKPRRNLRGLITNNFIELIMNSVKEYFTKNRSNFLISLRIINRQNNSIIILPFMPITNRTLKFYIEKMIKLLELFNNKINIDECKYVYFFVYKIPVIIDVTISKFPGGVYEILPSSMYKGDWDLFVKKFSYLQIINFKTIESDKGWVENRYHILDTRTNENYKIFDVRYVKDNDKTFLRQLNSNILHYIDGKVVSTVSLNYTNIN